MVIPLTTNKESADADAEGGVELELTDSGCRPCCSLPHGLTALLASLMATLAWIFSFITITNCHFLTPNYLYCHPPPEPAQKFGTCGDCHCINGDKPCPADPSQMPLKEVSNDWLKQLQAMDTTNPINMTCNPYNTTNYLNCSSPPMKEEEVKLWETAVCGHIYDMDSLDDNQCPTQYEMVTYDSKEGMEEAGAAMTHWGACGACSTSKDFGVYLAYPDLTAKGQECAIRGLPTFGGSFAEGVACFQEVGYTEPCAEMWMYNVINTRNQCFDVCFDFTFTGDGRNNGPPPECKIANCLLCDEQMSGPYFQTVAARSRRRSGLLSKIARSCDIILIVDHKPPCDVTQAKMQQTGRDLQSDKRITAPPKFTVPPPSETCIFIEDDLGLTSFETKKTNEFLIPAWMLPTDEREKISKYDSCRSYEFNGVVSGFWRNQKDIFGPAYNTAFTFGSMALILGIVVLACTWCSICVASGKRYWNVMTISTVLCGTFMLLTLSFFGSGVCENGCKFGPAAITAIVSCFIWWFAALLMFKSVPVDNSVPKANCCCCPTVKSSYMAVSTRDDDEKVDIEITEFENNNTEFVTEKVTKYQSGKTLTERTTNKKLPKEEPAVTAAE